MSDDSVTCPHCQHEIPMTDGERLQGHVSYWGQGRITSLDCPQCERDVFLQEYVKRWWTAGRTPQEACEL
ncbi:hypothetical protein MEX01_28900 [Methylorubrum extorquens]|uniref:hypothetical protein n=1 Tax=Methylorubrum extorquens TaxID=408 RepID=UPI00117495B2|nr:hypothetical protein [Methylorubrum extorquens]GEL42299.1 hypothetical protein MEX01_28900 [Methylorubrum extorquens]